MILISHSPISVLITGSALVFLAAYFFFFFFIPGIIHWFRLRKIRTGLLKLEARTPPGELKKLFGKDKGLAHLWKQYQDSLHSQREERDGQMIVTAVRSTVPAEIYFSNQYVVDSRLRTEFFKHLPGIFTGIGIIGTFSGLIKGLSHFQVTDNAIEVRNSLGSLMNSVGDAFWISASAILLAMVVTLIEKLVLASLYRQTEDIAHAIDARFDSGAGEEYLSRLVKASEDSASQSKILKDALVRDLGALLRELTDAQLASGERLHQSLVERLDLATTRQTEAAREANKELGAVISASIEKSLQGPLNEIASTVRSASGDQSSIAIGMLKDVMTSFSQRLNDLFGGQINGINDLNKQAAQGIQDAVNALNSLVAKMEDNGRKSTEDMASQMTAAIKAMVDRQSEINSQTQSFVEQIHKFVETSQSETNDKWQVALEALGQKMSTLLDNLTESQVKVFDNNRAREESMSDRATSMVSGLTKNIETAVQVMSAASKTMAQSVSILTDVTVSSIDKINNGAEQLNTAATNFATAGDRVNSAMGQAANVSAKLVEVSGSLTIGANAVQDTLHDYRIQREAVTQLLIDVRATIELAKKEASITSDVLRRIESSTSKLGIAQKAADDYVDGISEILANSNVAFRESVVSTLAKVNSDFHAKLSSAVGLLSSAVQELEVSLGSVIIKK